MTEERNTPDAVGETDALVTRTYREAANERAPDHLNQAVLKEAASAARPRYSRLMSWTRPMAWAATVMLSVALVLEMTRAPVPQSVTPHENAARFEAEAPELDVSGDAPEKAQIQETRVPEAQPEQAFRKRANDNQAPAQERVAPQPSSADEFKVKDVDMLIQAEEMARMQSEDKREANQYFTAAASGAVGRADEAPACDEPARTTPESWLECIENLEDAGLIETASEQRDQLKSAFPDFELP